MPSRKPQSKKVKTVNVQVQTEQSQDPEYVVDQSLEQKHEDDELTKLQQKQLNKYDNDIIKTNEKLKNLHMCREALMESMK